MLEFSLSVYLNLFILCVFIHLTILHKIISIHRTLVSFRVGTTHLMSRSFWLMHIVLCLAPGLSYQMPIKSCSGNKIINFLRNFAQALIIMVPCYYSIFFFFFLNTSLRQTTSNFQVQRRGIEGLRKTTYILRWPMLQYSSFHWVHHRCNYKTKSITTKKSQDFRLSLISETRIQIWVWISGSPVF